MQSQNPILIRNKRFGIFKIPLGARSRTQNTCPEILTINTNRCSFRRRHNTVKDDELILSRAPTPSYLFLLRPLFLRLDDKLYVFGNPAGRRGDAAAETSNNIIRPGGIPRDVFLRGYLLPPSLRRGCSRWILILRGHLRHVRHQHNADPLSEVT